MQDQLFAEREGIFGRRLVSGAFVFSAGLGLVATNCVNAFSYGYDKLRFIKPMFIGDTIYAIRSNLDKKPRYKDMGLIRASYEVFKGEGELNEGLTERHPAAARVVADLNNLFHKSFSKSPA